MATVDARTTRTLAEVFGSLSSETADSQTLLTSSTDGRAATASAPLENGVRVYTDCNKGLNCDIACDGGVPVVTRQGVETEASVHTSIGGQTRAVSGGREEPVKGLDSISGAGKNQDSGIENVAAERNPTPSVGDGPDRKVEFSGNGILLVVEVRGSLGSEKKCGYEDNKGYSGENGGVPGENFADAKVVKKGELTKDKGRKHEQNANGEEKGDGEDEGEDSGEEEEDDDEDDGEDVGDQERKYSVGDFVWGKIRSHPWWPGQIYDYSDASEYAANLSKKDCLLVAYFGDGSFSWCPPSQLKPFAEHFEEMSRQSNSKSFVNAVQKALDQIGRLVELEMTCSCISEEGQIRLTRPLVVNSGIKARVLVPEGATGELASLWRQPPELLACVRYIAKTVSISSLLEVTVLKSFLSAFYCAKGGFSLPIYHEPQDVEGLEDKNRNGVTRETDFNGPLAIPIKGPFEEEWYFSQASPSFGQTSQKGPMIAKDKLYQRRKEKSVAELMAEDMDVEPKNKNGGIIKEGVQSGKSASGKKKRKENGEAKNYDDIVLTSESERKRRKKKVDVRGSPRSPDNKVWGEDEGNESRSMEWKRNRVSEVGNDDDVAKEETKKISVPRERKKSKYLSPPYTDLKLRVRNSSSKRDLVTESEKIVKTTQIGERMTRAADQVIGSPPILKCSGETFKNKQSAEFDSGRDSSSSPQTTKGDQKKVINSLGINAKEVLSQVQSAALNPLYLSEKRSLDLFTGFISTFRSSIYLNGSNYKMYHKRQPGRKRKALHSEPGPLWKDPEQTIRSSPEPSFQRRKYEMNETAKLDKPRSLGRSARASSSKTNDRKVGTDASHVSLVVTFPPGFPLPSKNDIIKIFSKFGDLNETETDIFGNSNCARVVFVRSSDAKEAYSISAKKSPFGAADVHYRLRYSSAASKANDDDQKTSPPPKKTPNKAVASQSCDNEESGLCFIKQKLEMITSMLENSDGKISPEMKSNLEGEMKGLLEKISTVAK